jgi:hypothetical protein
VAEGFCVETTVEVGTAAEVVAVEFDVLCLLASSTRFWATSALERCTTSIAVLSSW